MKDVWIVAARRTAVVPRNGAFRDIEVWNLAAPVLRSLLKDCDFRAEQLDAVVMGNALYGGGNPARMAALAAGFPESLVCQTIDTQCCSGLDAVGVGYLRIRSGQDKVVLAGGLESWSRSPIRQHRPRSAAEEAQEYSRPPFSPFPENDPEPADSVAELAQARGITRSMQESYAIASHTKAIGSRERLQQEIVAVAAIEDDVFSRRLSARLCRRLPALAGDADHALTSATTAVEADAAAAVLLIGEEFLDKLPDSAIPVRICAVDACGVDSAMPALGPVAAVTRLMSRSGLSADHIQVAEIMEAYAAQAMSCISDLGLDLMKCNYGGGGLARGHPVGASGAINAVRLYHELKGLPAEAYGLAAIAAAGGLGSALLAQRS